MSRGREGVALVAALLTLSALAILALTTLLMTQLDLRMAENRRALALARAQSRSLLTGALLHIESQSESGELPETAPAAPGLDYYQRESSNEAVISVAASVAGASYRSDARVELAEMDDGWRLRVVERR